MTKSQILTEAMALQPQERDEVAEALWQSLVPGELSSEQMTEIRRRIRSADSGQSQPLPGEQVLHELRSRFQR